MSSSKEMKILFPAEQVKLSTGEVVAISPVPFGKLKYFSDAVAKVIKAVQSEGLAFSTIDYPTLFNVAFEEVVQVMMLILHKERDWFDNITIADGLDILTVIVRQNFNDNAKKNLEKLIASITSLLQTQSKS